MRVLFVQRNINPPGGGNSVAAWMLEALKHEHELSRRATDRYEEARRIAARFINAPDPAEVIWVRGTTEGINLVAGCWGRTFLKPGDEVVKVTAIDDLTVEFKFAVPTGAVGVNTVGWALTFSVAVPNSRPNVVSIEANVSASSSTALPGFVTVHPRQSPEVDWLATAPGATSGC